jgi:integrase
MASTRLTDLELRKAKPSDGRRLELFDDLVTGLCFRCTERGAKSWSLVYRFAGELRRDTLGPYGDKPPDLSLRDARQKARQRLELVSDGKDPRAVDAAAEAAEAERRRSLQENSVEAVVEEFIKREAGQLRWPDLERILRREIIPAWGTRPIAEIRKRDVIRLIDKVVDRGAPVAANRTLTIVKRLFRWAEGRDLIETSPAATIDKPTRERKRERILADAEILALWKAAETIGWPFGRIFQLLLLTGQRCGEIGGLRWLELDMAQKLIEIPGSRYKTRRPHVIPLPSSALAIIEELPKIGESDYAFTVTGKAPVVGHDKAKLRIDALMPAGTPHWTIHDIRRTVRTKLSEIGINHDIAERVLGHALPGERETYDRYSYLAEKRAALERWAAALDRIINPPAKGEKVVRLTRKRGSDGKQTNI